MDRDSSYGKIYYRLIQTTTFRQLRDNAINALSRARVEKIEFRLEQTDDSSRVVPVFLVPFAPENVIKFGPDVSEWNISDYSVFPSGTFTPVVTNHFGEDKEVKTRNCRKKILEDGKFENHRLAVPAFDNFARDEAMKDARPIVEEALGRIKRQAIMMKDSPAFATMEETALVTFCKQYLTKAMLKWRKMPEAVLKEAWNQFVTVDIMDL